MTEGIPVLIWDSEVTSRKVRVLLPVGTNPQRGVLAHRP